MRTRDEIQGEFESKDAWESIIILEVLLDIREMMLMPLAHPLYEVDVANTPKMICQWCNGTGTDFSSHLRREVQCGSCGGSGFQNLFNGGKE